MPGTLRVICILLAMSLAFATTGCGSGGGGTSPVDGDQSDGDIPGDGDVDQPDGDMEEDGDVVVDGDRIDTDDDIPIDGDEEPDSVIDGDTEPDTDGDVEPDATDGDIVIDGDQSESDGDVPTDGDDDASDPDLDPDLDIDPEPETPPCKVDFADLESMLPYSETHTTQGDDNSIASDCFGWDMSGADVVYSIVLEANDILEVVVTPENQDDLAVYVTASCALGADCLAGEDEALEGGAETLLYKTINGGTYYIVVDSRYPDTAARYDISVALVAAGDGLPGDPCTNDADCSDQQGLGSGRCLGDAPFMACSIQCFENVPADGDTDGGVGDNDIEPPTCNTSGFPSGCCLEVPALGGSYCHVAASCGEEGEVSGPAERCATAQDPNQPMCDITQDARYCIDNTASAYPYCTSYCTADANCGAFDSGCCVDTGGPYSICLDGVDCPHACVGDRLLEVAEIEGGLELSGTLAGSDNSIHALGCLAGGTAGGDYLYTFLLEAGKTLQATLDPMPGCNPVLLLAGECGWTNESCAAISNSGGIGEGETLTYTSELGEWVTLAVDSRNFGECGAYELFLEFVEAPEEEEIETESDGDVEQDVDLCQADVSLAASALPQTVDASTTASSDRLYLNEGCGSDQTPANDYIVEVTGLNSGQNVYLTLYGISGWNPALTVYSSCQNDACVDFFDSGLTGQGETAIFAVPSSGDYLIVVDSIIDLDAGDFMLDISFDPPVDGDVDEDVELDDDGEGALCVADFSVGTFDAIPYSNSANTIGANNDISLAGGSNGCASFNWPMPGPDHSYAIELQMGDSLDAVVSEVDSNFDVYLLITKDCSLSSTCATATASADRAGAGAGEFIAGFVAPTSGTYYVVVDSPFAGQGGNYKLELLPAGSVDGDVDQ